MSAHTGGIWKVSPHHTLKMNAEWYDLIAYEEPNVILNGSTCIAAFYGPDREANIHLCVRAPRLLTALEAMVQAFLTGEHYETKNPYRRPYVQEAVDLLKEIRNEEQDSEAIVKNIQQERLKSMASELLEALVYAREEIAMRIKEDGGTAYSVEKGCRLMDRVIAKARGES